MQTADMRYIYRKDLGKTCFQDDMAYRTDKDLVKRTKCDKFLK